MSEKMSLTGLSSKSWHYRLIKFVWGNTLPDPKSIHNFCLYWWVLVATLIISLFTVPIKLTIIGCMNGWLAFDKFLTRHLDERIEALGKKWAANLKASEAYEIHNECGWKLDRYYLKNITVPKLLNEKIRRDTIIQEWGIANGLKLADPNFQRKLDKMLTKAKFEWEKENNRKRKERTRISELNAKRAVAKKESDRKRRERMDKIATILEPLGKALLKLKPKFNNYGDIAKFGKRVLGIIITALVGVIAYYVIQILTLFVMALGQAWDTTIVLNWLGVFALILGSLVVATLLVWGLYNWVRNIIDKYNYENKIVWFIKPFVWLAIGLSFVGRNVFFYPCYFIFVSFLWKLICVSFLWGIIRGFGYAITKFGGIFGEYFGASYSDYCPGISWDNQTEDEDED